MFVKSFVLAFYLIMLAVSTGAVAKTKQVSLIFAGEMPVIGNNQQGDYPQLAGLIKRLKAENKAQFFFFAGGSLGPSPMSAFDRGAHIIDILNTLEPDLMAAGKREFSYYENELSLRSYEAAFPILASNIYQPETELNLDGLLDHLIIEKDGVKLGVISVLDESVVSEYVLTRIKVSSPKQTIVNKSRQLKQLGVDAVVLLYSADLPFVDQLHQNGVIDLSLFVDPHFNLLNSEHKPQHPHSVFIASAGKAAEVDIRIDETARPKVAVSWRLHKLIEQDAEPKTQKQVHEYSSRLDRLLDEEVGLLTSAMDTRRKVVRAQESGFANFVADSLRSFLGTDLAFINGGVIRGEKQYTANTRLTRRDIATELPFRSRIVVLDVTGRAIRQAVEHGLSMIEENKGRFLHFSGVRVLFDSQAPVGSRLKQLLINGAMVDENKTYRVATSDYLASGGDDFVMLKEAKQVQLNTRVAPLISEIVINNIRQQREIAPQLEQRLVDLATR